MNTVPESSFDQIAYVALGSNLGDRLGHLRSAIRSLQEDPEIRFVDASPVYESPAHTLSPDEKSPPFLNAVVEVSTKLAPRELLHRLHAIERATGRRREHDAPWAPRTLDLDLLIFGQTVIDGDELTLPHPRLGIRRFVLQPWADLDPACYVPNPYNKSVGELLAVCPDADRPIPTPLNL